MRADRLVNIMLLLQTRGKMTAAALAQTVGVSRRTVLRDVEALSMAGVPVYTEGGHGGGIALDEGYRTNLTGFHEAEIRTLFIAGSMSVLKELQLERAAQSSLLKLTASLPLQHQQVAQHIRQRILIDPAWWWRDASSPVFWNKLQQAVYEDRIVVGLYENYQGEVAERVLEPYSLVAKSGDWYLIAKRNQEFRNYRVARFHRLELLEDHFARDPGFDLATFWQDHMEEFLASMGEHVITLQVHPDRLNFVKWLTPGRHTVEESALPNAWPTVQIKFDSVELAKMLIFELGANAEVIAPRELYNAVVVAARAFCQPTAATPQPTP